MAPPETIETPQEIPRPRLVLRVGGQGNRNFGSDNGIDEPPEDLKKMVRKACDEVLDEMEKILLQIHADELNQELHHWPEPPPWWKTHCLACVFGGWDRWKRESLCGLPAASFSDESPLITLLTGGQRGADMILFDAGQARVKPGAKVEYNRQRIVADDPAKVGDGVGVGVNPPPAATLKPVLTANNEFVRPPLSRQEAGVRARVARQRAYGFRAQAEALRHHSDILLAVWDPDAEGRAGGTLESVTIALKERIPVIAVWLRGPGLYEIHLLESTAHFTALQQPSSSASTLAKDWKAPLKNALATILNFPDEEHADKKHAEDPVSYHPRAAFALFCAGNPWQRVWTRRFWWLYNAWARYHVAVDEKKAGSHQPEKAAKLEEARKEAWIEVRKAAWALLWGKKPSDKEPPAAKPDSFEAVYERIKKRASGSSMGMSDIYGDAHRGAIILSYLLAAVAVFLAVFGNISHHDHTLSWVTVPMAALEVMVIFLMFALATCSTTEAWNAAYTESRILAEALRMMKFLGPLGVHTPLPRLPYHLSGHVSLPRLWSIWYFRALVRTAPLRLASNIAPGDLDQHRKEIEAAIEDQKKHHAANRAKQECIHHGIERYSRWVFYGILVIACIHLVDALFEWHWLPAVSLIVCVGGPAYIAAVHGFASQMEVKRLSERSSSMMRLFDEHTQALKALDLKNHREAEAVWGLTAEALVIASIMMDETADWSLLYRNSGIHAG